MKLFTRIFQTFLISIFMISCAHREHSNELSLRSNYDKDSKRTRAKTTEIYIFPHEMPSGDRFMGGRVHAIIERENWK